MTPSVRSEGARLTSADVACWVIKSATAPGGIVRGWTPGTRRTVQRCLRPTYRLGLMAAGDRCLLWLSGKDEPGVQAIGVLTQEVAGAGSAAGPCVDVDLLLLSSPAPRAELLLDPGLSTVEVLRMPAGSNPSYLTVPAWTALIGHLDDDALREVGWA